MKCKRHKKCKYTLDDMQKAAQLKGGKCVSVLYNPDRMMWECADGHRWKVSPFAIRQGRWCPYCQWFFNEEKVRHILEHLTGFLFSRNRSILKGLELDGYCHDLKVAFEYNGKQHYGFTKFFHKTNTDFQKQQDRDKQKIVLCQKKCIMLIVIPYTVVTTDVSLISFIKHHLPTKYIQNYQKIEFRNMYVHFSVIRKLNNLAQSKDGKLLSTVYKGTHKALEWECRKSHKWKACPSSIKTGSWCPQCAGNIKLKLSEACNVASIKGGQCLSDTYINNRTKLEWQCKKEHRWKASLDNVKARSWCPVCSGKQRLTMDDMRALAKLRRGKCLSKRYINNSTKLEWQCACGYRWMASPGHIKNGTWCPKCAEQLMPTIEDMRELADGRGGKCLSDKYVNAHTKLEWQCKDGHIWGASPTNVKQGKWCKSCYWGERNEVQIL